MTEGFLLRPEVIITHKTCTEQEKKGQTDEFTPDSFVTNSGPRCRSESGILARFIVILRY
ncbi:MAG: hypothetical protein C0390_12510 [Syntrophus sp. (in: bacteria)]|nr:hypothetical protein [Syntrophus sp. (in: bacteria)]